MSTKRIEIETKALALAKTLVDSVAVVEELIKLGGVVGLTPADKEVYLEKVMPLSLKLETFLKKKDPALNNYSFLDLIKALAIYRDALSQATIFDTGTIDKIEVEDTSTGKTYSFNSKNVTKNHVNTAQILSEVGGASISTGTAGCEDIFTTKIKSHRAVEDAIADGRLTQSCMISESVDIISFDFDELV